MSRALNWTYDHVGWMFWICAALWLVPPALTLLAGPPWWWFGLTYALTASFGIPRVMAYCAFEWIETRR